MILRDYQQKLISDVRHAYGEGAKSVLMQLPTGGGKTAIMAHAARVTGYREGSCWL